MLELRDLSKLLFGVLDSLVNELEIEAGLDSGLNARDLVNSVTEESCLTSSFQNSKVPFLMLLVCLSLMSLIMFLVMMSAELFFDLLTLISKSFFSCRSLRKWCLISMCFVLVDSSLENCC
jgi:hypothetical protein